LHDAAYSEYQDIHIANSFLLTYSLMEEWFMIFRDRTQLNVHGLDRFRDGFRKFLNDESRFMSFWSEMSDFERIRHCQLHANGRIDLMKNPVPIESFLRAHPAFIKRINERLVLLPAFLARFVELVRSPFEPLVTIRGKDSDPTDSK